MNDCIDLRNIRVNNLKNISLKIPHDKFIVVGGGPYRRGKEEPYDKERVWNI